jgi:fibronectin-binding autotransporter adhesin
MNSAKIVSTIATVSLTLTVGSRGMAQLTEFQWNNPALVGTQSWQVDGNWNMAGWPDDPGRTEPAPTVIVPSEGASLSVGLTGNLTLDVGPTNVTVASLKLGGTAGAVTTDIISTFSSVPGDYNGDGVTDAADYVLWRNDPGSFGGDPGYGVWRANFGNTVPVFKKLVFENYEANDNSPADPNPDICAFNCGQALVTSVGVVGSTNIISAPVHINGERLVFDSASTNDLTISGPVTFANLGAPASASSIRSLSPTKLTITGSISLVDTVTGAGAPLTINDENTLPPLNPPPGFQRVVSTGTIEISGVIQDTGATTGAGSLVIGMSTNPPANQVGVLSTVILSGANTFRGATALQRANLVLANNSALGIDTNIGNDRSGGASLSGNQAPASQFGFNLLSDNDSRTISVDARISQWLTITGSHSLTWAGVMTQANARGIANLLPEGKSFTISGVMYGSSVSGTDTTFENRIFTLDGTGTTHTTGGWRNKIKGGIGVNDTTLGHYRKAGTGTVFVSDPGDVSDFSGDVIVDQGVMRFTSDTIFDQGRNVTSTGGAIGVDTGTFTNSTLLTKLIFATPFDTMNTQGLKLNHGGLMLTAGESASAIDFTSGDLANVSNMSVAAPQDGITFTGSITPDADFFTTVPTYRLGGGNGVLTLPTNQLTGARNVQITNGGEVRLNGLNTYSGVTRIQAKYHTTSQNQAIANTMTNTSNVVYEGTTLTVNTLLDGGADSSIGSSSNAASNLVIQGSTLKYAGTGANGSTDRLFTVGTGGATLDASGESGSVMNFTNSGALVMDLADPQIGSIFDTGTAVPDGVAGTIRGGARVNLQHVDDIVVGMTVFGMGDLAGGELISAVNNPTPLYQNFQVTVPLNAGANTPENTVTFNGVARTFTLTGTNMGDNTLAPLIADAASTPDPGVNTVNVAKNGTGKWILTGNNTYTGTTNVNAGTILINGVQTGTGLTTVAAAGTLGGTGTLGGALTNNGTVSPGASVGTLTVNGNVIMGANSHFAVELSGATSDLLAITGDLDLLALGNFLDVSGAGTGTSWVIATYTGALTGMFETVTSGYVVDYGTMANSQVTLNVVSDGSSFAGVPEPSGILLCGIALVSSVSGLRRRRLAILVVA